MNPINDIFAGTNIGGPPIGFGCCPMGLHGWGVVEEEALIQAVHSALDAGIRIFDTADIYGFGTSENILGRALGNRRDEAIIATKFGVRHESGRSFHDTSLEWMSRALEGSLRRLRVETIDLYQMHYWDGKTPLTDIVGLLQTFVRQGKIRSYGVTNFDPGIMVQNGADQKFRSFSYQYSLIDRDFENLIDRVQSEADLAFFSWGSLGQGVLSGKHRDLKQLDPKDRRLREVYRNFHGPRFEAIQPLLDRLSELGPELNGATPAQIALRWIVERVPRAIALVGIKRPEQIIEAAAVAKFKLGNQLCAELSQLSAASFPVKA